MPDDRPAIMFPMFRYDSGIMTKLEYCTVGITPGMKLHASFMGFFNHEFQRIIKGNRRFSLLASEPFTPGFNSRREKSIAGRSHLNDYSIHTVSLVHIEL